MDSDEDLKGFCCLNPTEQTIVVLGKAMGTLTRANDPDRKKSNKLSQYLYSRSEGPTEATSLAAQAGALAIGEYIERTPGVKGTDDDFVNFAGQVMLDMMKISVGALEVGGVISLNDDYKKHVDAEEARKHSEFPEEFEGAVKVDSGSMDGIEGLKQLAAGLKKALLAQAQENENDEELEDEGEDEDERLN